MATKRAKSSKVRAKKPALMIVETPKAAEPTPPPSLAPGPVSIPISQALLAPELRKQVVETPTPVVAADERARAREERRAKKQIDLEERRRRRIEANVVSANVVPISRTTSNSQPIGVEPVSKSQDHMKLPIPDALKYKLLYTEGEYKRLSESIRYALKQAAQARLAADIKKALQESLFLKASLLFQSSYFSA